MTLRAVVVGTGFGCVTHVRALRAAGFDIVALVGRDPQRTAERAQLFDDERALTSLSDALALPGVDAVTIATPPHTHAELALEAIAAGHHVLCEKPLARDVGEARAMLAVAEDAGIVHLDDMNAALELLATGASCGKLAFIRRHEGQPTAAVSTR